MSPFINFPFTRRFYFKPRIMAWMDVRYVDNRVDLQFHLQFNSKSTCGCVHRYRKFYVLFFYLYFFSPFSPWGKIFLSELNILALRTPSRLWSTVVAASSCSTWSLTSLLSLWLIPELLQNTNPISLWQYPYFLLIIFSVLY